MVELVRQLRPREAHRVHNRFRHISELLRVDVVQARAVVDGPSEIHQGTEVDWREGGVGGKISVAALQAMPTPRGTPASQCG